MLQVNIASQSHAAAFRSVGYREGHCPLVEIIMAQAVHGVVAAGEAEVVVGEVIQQTILHRLIHLMLNKSRERLLQINNQHKQVGDQVFGQVCWAEY